MTKHITLGETVEAFSCASKAPLKISGSPDMFTISSKDRKDSMNDRDGLWRIRALNTTLMHYTTPNCHGICRYSNSELV